MTPPRPTAAQLAALRELVTHDGAIPWPKFLVPPEDERAMVSAGWILSRAPVYVAITKDGRAALSAAGGDK